MTQSLSDYMYFAGIDLNIPITSANLEFVLMLIEHSAASRALLPS